ncbi:MAG: endolytic transglycosylase MltG [Sinobacterium sp.]|nr:endolytic transglycosylase MltG [Sinobacterium sp.]
MKNFIALSLSALIFSAMLVAGLSLKHLSAPIELSEDTTIDVIYGDSIYKVASKMQAAGIIEYPRLLVIYARLFDLAPKIKAGEYQVVSGQSPLQVLDNIVKNKVIEYKLTIIEGWTAKEAILALQAAEGIVTTLNVNNPQSILAAVGADAQYSHIEGIFYPDTYNFRKGTKDVEILKVAYKKMNKVLADAWAKKADKLPYKTPYEALIMASIIERETGVGEERAQISGVFVERLYKGMRLQTDPTVIYGMGDKYNGKIRRKDLLEHTPYNTYTIRGLPPTPIALSNESSVQAALHPLLNGKIYFVAKGNGYHQFSSNLSDHRAAVKKFQLNRKSSYRSTPAK